MSKVPLAERKDLLAKKKVECQLTHIPKSRPDNLVIVEAKMNIEDQALGVALPLKIQKQIVVPS